MAAQCIACKFNDKFYSGAGQRNNIKIKYITKNLQQHQLIAKLRQEVLITIIDEPFSNSH